MTIVSAPVGSEKEREAIGIARGRASGAAPRIFQFFLLTVLFSAPVLMCLHMHATNDTDVWWHLRTGEWIQQHHRIPHVDYFSRTETGKPWEAYSWLFELLILRCFQGFGLQGILGYSAMMVLAITLAIWHLVKRMQADFTMVAILTFVACRSLGHLFTPRPWLFTILFFVIELDILLYARKMGKARELAWLPLIFALWSNLHIQFVYGLLLLGAAVVEALLSKQKIGKTLLGPASLITALALSVVATLANPFGPHIYRVVYNLATHPGGANAISELGALPFRDINDFCVLFLTLGAVATMVWTRRLQFFEMGLLLLAAAASFHAQRDLWVVVIAATGILAQTISCERENPTLLRRVPILGAVLLGALVGLAGFRLMHTDNGWLQAEWQKSFPVDAADAVRANSWRGPLFNDFDWGGYLAWSLRVPVSIDSRGGFYGDEAISRSIDTWNGRPGWASDPELRSAGLVIGPIKSPLIQLLRMDQHFQLAYEDKVAAVFVARK